MRLFPSPVLRVGLGLAFATVLFPFAVPSLRAQNAGAQIGYVYPAGARRGETVRVIVGGRQLQGVEEALVSGEGVGARVLGVERPLKPEERNKLREELAGLKKQTEPPPDAARLAELQQQLAQPGGGALPPALQETVTLELSLAPDAAPGPRDLRLRGRGGLTLPLVFVVGDLPELSFPPVAATAARSAPGSEKAVAQALGEALTVTPPVVVNGQILAGESDRVRFVGKKGWRLIVAVHARALVPYLADAVPGWFQAVTSLRDAQGNELAFADDFRFSPDPVLAFRLPADGDYTLIVRDALYRGREDFVYRVALGELPFVAGVFPLGGRPGEEVDFALNGWNLPAATRRARLPEVSGVHVLELGPCRAATGEIGVEVDERPAIAEIETGEGPGSEPQRLAPPVVVDGRIGRPRDADEFSFFARAGEPLVIGVSARGLRSPLDGVLQVFGPDGKVVADNDDCEDGADGLSTHHADPRVSFAPAVDGVHRVRLADAQGRGGHDFGYRLHVGPPRPDFALRVVPSSVNLRRGGSAKVSVYAWRRDGFAGAVSLALSGAPPGWRIEPAEIPAGAEKVELTLFAGGRTPPGVVKLELNGAATTGGVVLRRRAVPADDRMQAFFYRHLVPAQEWVAAVRGGK